MQSYRQTLALSGLRSLLVIIFFARIPVAAAPVVLTLHVAIGLGRGYGEAGIVGAAATIGIALGSPFIGRVVDRHGLRAMLVIVTLGESLFWFTARLLPYELLIPASFVGGFLVLPAMSIGRQAISALVPEDLRRTAYSLDSVSNELTFMVGPASAVALATQLSTGDALTAMGAAICSVGVLLMITNPKVRADHEDQSVESIPRREWLTPRLISVFAVGAGAVFVLAGVDVTVIAVLRENGELDMMGVVIAIMCLSSAAAGFVNGLLKRSPSQATLMAVMGLLTLPVGLLTSPWWLFALVLIPACALCAPTLTATNELVSLLAPAPVRGVATGLQSSAFTIGAAAGAPVVGFVIDHASTAWAFVAAGLGGVLVAIAAGLTARLRDTRVPVLTSAHSRG